MSRIQTYVFIDLETTGLPREEYNKTRITELSMVAVKRQHLLETRPGATPRVQHKLTLCLNPRRMVTDGCSAVTGLDNYLLEHEPNFNKQVFTMIDTFLSILSQPVCLVAQNGLSFDYPILKNHLVKLNVDFTCEVYCADCYHGFYHILEKIKLEREMSNQSEEKRKEPESSATCNPAILSTDCLKISPTNESVASPTNDFVISPRNDSVISPTNDSIISPTNDSVISPTNVSVISPSSETNVDEIDFQTSYISMQTVNETTPKSNRTIKPPKACFKAKRKLVFPWGDGPKPTDSYKLKDIYERVLNKPGVDAHRAENDCIFALEISSALSKQFVEWVDNNHKKFSAIVPMTIGVPM